MPRNIGEDMGRSLTDLEVVEEALKMSNAMKPHSQARIIPQDINDILEK